VLALVGRLAELDDETRAVDHALAAGETVEDSPTGTEYVRPRGVL
jgi:hypothetical protein